ncbi:MAG: hypothetical protein JNM38_18145 [Acidobacteria bacterium]|nr:hypothetical protein [Acidobacteriota bacterium]
MSPSLVPASLTLPVADLLPVPEHFVHRSRIHGQGHVARVMVHAFRLLRATGYHDETARLWASVFLHDLARVHDGHCTVHGADAWRRFEDEAWLQKRIAQAGIVDDDHVAIATAVTMHSRSQEVASTDPHWRLTALLKDADALDRVRIDDLDPGYLRFTPSREMAGFAQALFDHTRRLATGPTHFAEVLAIAGRLEGELG